MHCLALHSEPLRNALQSHQRALPAYQTAVPAASAEAAAVAPAACWGSLLQTQQVEHCRFERAGLRLGAYPMQMAEELPWPGLPLQLERSCPTQPLVLQQWP